MLNCLEWLKTRSNVDMNQPNNNKSNKYYPRNLNQLQYLKNNKLDPLIKSKDS